MYGTSHSQSRQTQSAFGPRIFSGGDNATARHTLRRNGLGGGQRTADALTMASNNNNNSGSSIRPPTRVNTASPRATAADLDALEAARIQQLIGAIKREHELSRQAGMIRANLPAGEQRGPQQPPPGQQPPTATGLAALRGEVDRLRADATKRDEELHTLRAQLLQLRQETIENDWRATVAGLQTTVSQQGGMILALVDALRVVLERR